MAAAWCRNFAVRLILAAADAPLAAGAVALKRGVAVCPPIAARECWPGMAPPPVARVMTATAAAVTIATAITPAVSTRGLPG